MATDQHWCPHRHRCHWHHRRLGASPRAMSPPAPDSCGPPGPICARGTVSMTPPPPGPPVTGCRAGRPATSPTYALRTTRRPSSMTAALGSAPRRKHGRYRCHLGVAAASARLPLPGGRRAPQRRHRWGSAPAVSPACGQVSGDRWPAPAEAAVCGSSRPAYDISHFRTSDPLGCFVWLPGEFILTSTLFGHPRAAPIETRTLAGRALPSGVGGAASVAATVAGMASDRPGPNASPATRDPSLRANTKGGEIGEE